MSLFDVKENRAICALPWVHEFKNLDGNTAPCCAGDSFKDGETLESTREDMLKGVRPRACNSCYKTEDESGWSKRIQETNDWINKFGTPDVDHPVLQFIDVRYDPV